MEAPVTREDTDTFVAGLATDVAIDHLAVASAEVVAAVRGNRLRDAAPGELDAANQAFDAIVASGVPTTGDASQ
jgi:hypothetical protein